MRIFVFVFVWLLVYSGILAHLVSLPKDTFSELDALMWGAGFGLLYVLMSITGEMVARRCLRFWRCGE